MTGSNVAQGGGLGKPFFSSSGGRGARLQLLGYAWRNRLPAPEERSEGSRSVEGEKRLEPPDQPAHTPTSPGRGGPRRGDRGSELLMGWRGRFWRPADERGQVAPPIGLKPRVSKGPSRQAGRDEINHDLREMPRAQRRSARAPTATREARALPEVAVGLSVFKRARAFCGQGHSAHNVDEPIAVPAFPYLKKCCPTPRARLQFPQERPPRLSAMRFFRITPRMRLMVEKVTIICSASR